MAKVTKNSGFNRQDAVLGQFRRDALSSNNSAVVRCLELGRKKAEYQAKMALKEVPRFTGKIIK